MAEKTKPNPHDVMHELIADFKCSICLEVYVDATWTSCHHLFCRFCISKWLQFSPKCPQCHTVVGKCTPMKAIDDQVDSLFQTLPLSIRKDRDDVKERRRKLEAEGCGSIEHTNELLKKLRVQRDPLRAPLAVDEIWLEKLMPTVSEENKLQLPRLVPAAGSGPGSGGNGSDSKVKEDTADKSKDQKHNENKSKSSNSSQYENLKLPPIKSSNRHGRQARGITTTTCSQNSEDKFPMNMEGDISKESAAEDNIRELERRNKILEDQLFGTYDRIMEAIKENDETLARNVNLNPSIFQDNKHIRVVAKNSKQGGSDSSSSNVNFNRESMMNTQKGEMESLQQGPGHTDDVEDLLAETEELMEIEDFLKKFPFERIRDDDNLMNYNVNTDDFDLDDDLGLAELGLDQDQLDQIAAHRAQRAKLPLTKEQEAIENFYKKLESKVRKQDGNVVQGMKSVTKVPKSVTQETSSSKMKRIPNLNQSVHCSQNPLRVPSNPSLVPVQASLNSLNRTGSKSSIASKVSNLSNTSINNSSNNKDKNSSIPKTTNNSFLNPLEKLQLLPNKARKTISSIGNNNTSNNNNNHSISNGHQNLAEKAKVKNRQNISSSTNTNIKKSTTGASVSTPPNPATPATADNGLRYDEFLKLEIDFLDGDGDWKQFEKPPDSNSNTSSPYKSFPTRNAEKSKVKSAIKQNANIAKASLSNKFKSLGSPGGSKTKLKTTTTNLQTEKKLETFKDKVNTAGAGAQTRTRK